MSASDAPATPPPRLQRLLGFLDHDPSNVKLIADAASAALEEGHPAEALRLLERYAAISPLPPSLINLTGLVAIEEQRFADAAKVFEGLLGESADSPTLRFNIAWCKAMLNDFAGAETLLDDAAIGASRLAPALKIQMLHHLGRLEDALAWGQGLAQRYPDNLDLMGALAAVAIDAEDLALADYYAARAGEQHDGLATRGMLSLNEDKVDESLAIFERALGAYPQDARALLGKGLGLLAKGEVGPAADAIDRAAELFGRHLGSWVAAGWAYYVNGDYATSRSRFERALAIDDTFAEIHGGLAVLDIQAGLIESARRRTEIALRLDRRCFSGALARMLILSAEGDQTSAARVRDIALNAPLGSSGRTLAQAMASMGLAARQPKQ
jgi:tetratricopeptide (TPR) repeat protein